MFVVFIVGLLFVGVNCQTPSAACTPPDLTCNARAPYRTFDGSCNNLKKPWMGMAYTPYSRLLSYNYRDGVSLPVKDLPSARNISSTIFMDHRIDVELTQFWMEFGQLIAHDTVITLDCDFSLDCCLPQNQLDEQRCCAVKVPSFDGFYSQFGVNCLNIVRHKNTVNQNCNNGGPAEQINEVTQFMDASDIYGSNLNTSNSLRTFVGGKINTTRINNKEFMPLGKPGPICKVTGHHQCFMSGDARVNQNPTLIVVTTAFYIIHNKIAHKLGIINPHWDDEKLFQETRKIIIAVKQHVTYKYWLPPLIGTRFAYHKKLMPLEQGHCNLYNDNIDLRTLNEFAGANFRIPHFSIQGHLDMVDRFGQYQYLNLSNHFESPGIEQDDGNYDKLMFGMGAQNCRDVGGYLTNELRNLMKKQGKAYGDDLVATDIQRGRERGTAFYVEALKKLLGICIKTFDDLKPLIDPNRFEALRALYGNDPRKIELFVGATLENYLPGTFVGPTNQWIFGEQFYRYKVGDRFWHERPGQFTSAQLQEIRKFTPAKLMCEGSHNLKQVPLNPFLEISKSNPLVNCDSMPKLDFHKWTEARKG